MSLRIRFQHPTGASLSYSIERLADGLFYDFADSTFKEGPKAPTATLPEDSGLFKGRYKVTLDPTPVAQFPDGDYCVTVHNAPEAAANVADVVAELAATMFAGDDQPPTAGAIAAAVLKQLGGRAITLTLPA